MREVTAKEVRQIAADNDCGVLEAKGILKKRILIDSISAMRQDLEHSGTQNLSEILGEMLDVMEELL